MYCCSKKYMYQTISENGCVMYLCSIVDMCKPQLNWHGSEAMGERGKKHLKATGLNRVWLSNAAALHIMGLSLCNRLYLQLIILMDPSTTPYCQPPPYPSHISYLAGLSRFSTATQGP